MKFLCKKCKKITDIKDIYHYGICSICKRKESLNNNRKFTRPYKGRNLNKLLIQLKKYNVERIK
jgi:hypothetical protein